MIEKKRTTDNKKENLKFQKIAKKQKLQEAGITLIALAVTIIILLILAGVTLNIALSDNGLIKKSQEATEKYKQAQNKEEESISDIAKLLYSDYIGEKVTGYKPTQVTIPNTDDLLSETMTGSSENTSFTTEDLGWRIWDYDGETLRLISDKPTSTSLILNKVQGYNNGVYVINQICRQCYTDQSIDSKYIKVRNLRRSDIEAVSNYDYTTYKHEEDGWEEVTEEDTNEIYIHYGEEKTYTQYFQAPKIWAENDIKWTYKYNTNNIETGEKSCLDPWEQEYGGKIGTETGETTAETNFKQSFYWHNYDKTEFNNSKYYDIIFKKEDGAGTSQYWLAGRYARLQKEACNFGLHQVYINSNYDNISGDNVFNSIGNTHPCDRKDSTIYYYRFKI